VKSVVRSAAIAFSVRNRHRKAEVISEFIRRSGIHSVILVGTRPNDPQRNGSIVEGAIARGSNVLAACDINPAVSPWPFVQADGCALPYADRCSDLVLSNAVIEHVGDEADQARFVAEHDRVGRHWVITTPNRWFPVESHTYAVVRHWSRAWRRAHRADFTRLLSRREFRALLPGDARIRGHFWSPTFIAFSPAGSAPLPAR
jgi:hypothetical protein